MYRQGKWTEPLVFEISRQGAKGHLLPTLEKAIGPVEDRRLAYIMYELILSSGDWDNVSRSILNPDTKPITAEEVGAAEDSFQDQMEGE